MENRFDIVPFPCVLNAVAPLVPAPFRESKAMPFTPPIAGKSPSRACKKSFRNYIILKAVSAPRVPAAGKPSATPIGPKWSLSDVHF